MKNINIKVVAFVLVSCCSLAQAQQTSVPNTFVAGENAAAAEVNANFSALVTLIDDLTARVNQLESDAPSNDVSGFSYMFSVSEVGFASSNGDLGFARTDICSIAGNITFNSNGTTGSISTTDDDCSELVFSLGSTRIEDLDPEIETESFTFDQTGSTVTLTFTDEDLSFNVSADGNLLVSSNSFQEDEPENGVGANSRGMELIIAIRSEDNPP